MILDFHHSSQPPVGYQCPLLTTRNNDRCLLKSVTNHEFSNSFFRVNWQSSSDDDFILIQNTWNKKIENLIIFCLGFLFFFFCNFLYIWNTVLFLILFRGQTVWHLISFHTSATQCLMSSHFTEYLLTRLLKKKKKKNVLIVIGRSHCFFWCVLVFLYVDVKGWGCEWSFSLQDFPCR